MAVWNIVIRFRASVASMPGTSRSANDIEFVVCVGVDTEEIWVSRTVISSE